MVTTMTGESVDITKQNIEKLKQLFPEILTDGEKIDFDMLKTILGEQIDGEQERYQFTWHGKRKYVLDSQKPSKKTLLPMIDKSKGFFKTKNVYIEGDNLDVLKILQKSYNSKIKAIYIDPPYNTGKWFTYKDAYSESEKDYLLKSQQIDDEGRKISTYSESKGRVHTNWLNFLYTRLRVARNLLTKDGIIFISIDDNEQGNLKKISDEIFGKSNFICQYIWQKKKGGGNDSKYVAVEHEYILAYAKNINELNPLFVDFDQEYLKRYSEEDEIGKYYWDTFKRKSGKQYYPITCPDGSILEFDSLGNKISWLRSEKRFKEDLTIGEVRFVKTNNEWSIHFKQRLPEGKKPRSILSDLGSTSDGSKVLLELFGKYVFDNPKPVDLIKYLLKFSMNKNDIVMDFFSGSATTAQAVMELNAEDGGTRSFIMVQLPEEIEEDAEIYSEGYRTICDIGEERICRAGEKIKQDLIEKQQSSLLEENTVDPEKLDIGFKVFKLDSSNIREWNVDFDKIEEQMDGFATPFVEGRADLGIVYEIMLKNGLELTYPIETFEVDGKTIYDIADGTLFVCLAQKIDTQIAKAIIACRNSYGNETSSVIFSDAGFENNDAQKLNCIELLKDAGYPDDSLLTI